MKYKVEVVYGKKLLVNSIYKNYSHPNQAVNKAVGPIKDKYDYFTIYVMNASGEVWVFGAERVKEGLKIWPIDHDYQGKGVVISVFSGNINISQVVK